MSSPGSMSYSAYRPPKTSRLPDTGQRLPRLPEIASLPSFEFSSCSQAGRAVNAFLRCDYWSEIHFVHGIRNISPFLRGDRNDFGVPGKRDDLERLWVNRLLSSYQTGITDRTSSSSPALSAASADAEDHCGTGSAQWRNWALLAAECSASTTCASEGLVSARRRAMAASTLNRPAPSPTTTRAMAAKARLNS